jgi:hypothetical protein
VITWAAVGSAHRVGFQCGAVSAGSAPGQLWHVDSRARSWLGFAQKAPRRRSEACMRGPVVGERAAPPAHENRMHLRNARHAALPAVSQGTRVGSDAVERSAIKLSAEDRPILLRELTRAVAKALPPGRALKMRFGGDPRSISLIRISFRNRTVPPDRRMVCAGCDICLAWPHAQCAKFLSQLQRKFVNEPLEHT